MRFLAIAFAIIAIAFGPTNSAKADCPNGQCSTVQTRTLESLMAPTITYEITVPARTATTVTYPERKFVVTEIKPKAKKRFKLNIFKKCGG